MLKKYLEQLGLSAKEACVYLASLELGASPVQKIAQQAKINRATTYVIIESLAKKGLMSTVEKGAKVFFTAEDPANLSSLLLKQKKDIEEKEKVLSHMLPELDILFKTTGDRPVVRFFEGLEGTRTIRRELLKIKSKKVYGVEILDNLYRAFPKHEDELARKRIKKGIDSKMIYTSSSGKVENATSKEKRRVARFVPFDLFGDTGVSLSVYDNKVSITKYKDSLGGVLIEDEKISQFMEKLFELAWDGAKKHDTE